MQRHGRSAPAAIEDRLSDALHESITQRFVDRRSALLVRHLASDGELMTAVSKSGEVLIEGAYVGRLDGLRFVPEFGRWCRDPHAGRRRQPRAARRGGRPRPAACG